MNWLDRDTEEESNETVHWISCRKLKGKEYKQYRRYFDRDKNGDWQPGETVESELVLRFIHNREDYHLNQAFIFPSPKKGNDTIRDIIYQVQWLSEYHYELDIDLAIVLKKCIWHEY